MISRIQEIVEDVKTSSTSRGDVKLRGAMLLYGVSLPSARTGLSDLGIAADGDAPLAQPHRDEAASEYVRCASHRDRATCLRVKLRHGKQLAQLIHRKRLMMPG